MRLCQRFDTTSSIATCRDIFVKSLARKSETIKRIHSMAIKFDLFENLVKDGIVASKLHVK